MVIAVIITAAATLFGPVLAVYVQFRISQPRPKPEVKQPNALIRWILLLMRVSSSPWILILPVTTTLVWVFALFSIVSDFIKPYPLNKETVFLIAVLITGINVNGTYVFFFWLVKIVQVNRLKQEQINRDILDIIAARDHWHVNED